MYGRRQWLFLIANTESEENIEKVKEYIELVIDIAYEKELKDCNYIYAMYFNYLQGYEIQDCARLLYCIKQDGK